MEKEAYDKGIKIIRSCKSSAHIKTAYNYVFNFRNIFGDTDMWNKLYEKCSKKRKTLGGL